MSIIDRIRGLFSPDNEPEARSSSFPELEEFILGRNNSPSGVRVTPQTAMQFSAVYACNRILSETVGSLPLILYERMRNGRKRAQDYYLYPLLHDAPNPLMTAIEYRETLQLHLGTWGNAYSSIEYDSQGQITALWPLRPDRMLDSSVLDGRRWYLYQLPSGEMRKLSGDTVWHLRGMGSDGLNGYSPIALHRRSIALGLAAQEFGERFFGNDARPGGVLEHPGQLKDPKRLRDSWEAGHRGLNNSHRIAVLEDGMQFKEIGIPPQDAQYIECVVPGTLIAMADGSQQFVEDLKKGDKVLSWGDGPTPARVSAVGLPADKPLVRMVTARGRELTASFDHPVLTKKALRTPGGRPDTSEPSWVPIGQLTPGTYVRVGLADFKPAGQRNGKAWLMGLLIGDGYLRSGGCSVASDCDEVVKEAGEILATMGGGLKKKAEYAYSILTGGSGCAGSEIRDWLNASGQVDRHADTKRVPANILSGGREAWIGFLSGYLDADGSVNDPDAKSQPKVYWSSVNRELLTDCQHMLAMLGINGAVYLMRKAKPKTVLGRKVDAQAQWGLFVTGRSQLKMLAAILQPVNPKKSERLRAYQSVEDSVYREHNWLYDRVKEVELAGVGPTVGVEVENVHTHITAGIVTHNTRKFQIEEIARIYRIPPHMIADLSNATFTNIEHQGIEFVEHTMRPWFVRWEQSITQNLMLSQERQRYYAEFLVDALLRGDTVTRYQAYAQGRQNGWLSANDIRELENMNPIPDGDQYLIPLNMIPAGAAGSREAMRAAPGERQVESREEAEARLEARQMRSASARHRLRGAHLQIYRDTAARILRREVHDVGVKARKTLRTRDIPSFRVWLEEFYRDHADYVIRQMEPVNNAYGEAVSGEAQVEVDEEVGMTEAIEKFLASYTGGFAARHIGRSLDILRGVLQEAQANPDVEPLDVIEAELETWEDTRSNVIAEQESTRLGAAVAKVVYVNAGITVLTWRSYGSEACPYCQKLDGKTVGIYENFVNAGDNVEADGSTMSTTTNVGHPPLHDGCECQIVAGR